MPVFTKPRTTLPRSYENEYRRADLVGGMMTEAAGSLPPAEWLDAAKAALAVADELYPESGEEVANG